MTDQSPSKFLAAGVCSPTAFTTHWRAFSMSKPVCKDLSDADIPQLLCLYETARAATNMWQGGHNQPRADRGAKTGVNRVLDKEFERCWQICQDVVQELRLRQDLGEWEPETV